METTTTKDVKRELMIMFSWYGIQSFLKADNAPQISSDCEEFREFCSTNGIKLLNTIPYWPQSNGEELGKIRRNELRLYLLTYHSSKHPTTGKSPGEMMFGRPIKSKLPAISNFPEDEEVRERDALIKEKGRDYSGRKRHAKESDIRQGDVVLAKRVRKANKLDTEFSNEEFVVQCKEGTDTLIQSKLTGKKYRRSLTHLKKIEDQETLQETHSNELRDFPDLMSSTAQHESGPMTNKSS
ncbi:uncharacterized protein K02A2.6-like [Uranotaenia lowii]|uniref:uncharacterized protein K02A2.6-like n=1 Tax=Uranotaenia lowii TaxID=190385 RepID=UPI00247A7136|nr:uncharacterized protein K02A2.6-like [Uranotaenia lowii]